MDGVSYNKKSILEKLDSTPTAGSENAVQSSGVKSYVDTVSSQLSGRISNLAVQIASPFNYKGAVANISSLPQINNVVNDTYYVVSEKCLYSYDGTSFSQSSMDETGYLSIINTLRSQYATEFDNTATYELGDVVLYNNLLYICKVRMDTPGEFSTNYFRLVDSSGDLVQDYAFLLRGTLSEDLTPDTVPNLPGYYNVNSAITVQYTGISKGSIFVVFPTPAQNTYEQMFILTDGRVFSRYQKSGSFQNAVLSPYGQLGDVSPDDLPNHTGYYLMTSSVTQNLVGIYSSAVLFVLTSADNNTIHMQTILCSTGEIFTRYGKSGPFISNIDNTLTVQGKAADSNAVGTKKLDKPNNILEIIPAQIVRTATIYDYDTQDFVSEGISGTYMCSTFSCIPGDFVHITGVSPNQSTRLYVIFDENNNILEVSPTYIIGSEGKSLNINIPSGASYMHVNGSSNYHPCVYKISTIEDISSWKSEIDSKLNKPYTLSDDYIPTDTYENKIYALGQGFIDHNLYYVNKYTVTPDTAIHVKGVMPDGFYPLYVFFDSNDETIQYPLNSLVQPGVVQSDVVVPSNASYMYVLGYTIYPISVKEITYIDDISSWKSEIKEALAIAYGAYISETAQGTHVMFSDGADDIPVKELIANIDIVQQGSGTPDVTNPRLFSPVTRAKITHGGKNLLNNTWNTTSGTQGDATLSKSGDDFVVDGSNTSGTSLNFYLKRYDTSSAFSLPAGTYTLSGLAAGSACRLSLYKREGGANTVLAYTENGTLTKTFTLSAKTDNCFVVIVVPNNAAPNNEHIRPMLTWGSEAADFEPYTDVALTIPFGTEAGNVYGGTLNVTTGELTVTHKMVDLGTKWWSLETRYGCNLFYTNLTGYDGSYDTSAMSVYPHTNHSYDENFPDRAWRESGSGVSRINIRDDRYSSTEEFKTGVSGVEFVYKLATPITYRISENEVKTLLGGNNISADTGDVSVTYRADTKLYIQSQLS